MDGKALNTANMAQQQGHENQTNHSEANESPVGIAVLYVPVIALAGSVFMLFIFRLWSILLNRQRLRLSINNASQSRSSRANRAKSVLNKHLIYAPLFERRHNRELRICRGSIHMGTIPTRVETILIISYSAINVVFCVCAIDWSQRITESLHTIIGTTGTLAVVNLIPLVLTAGRNNPFIPLLRVSFDTFNLVHRWIGRIIVVESIAHTVAVLVRVGLWSKLILDPLDLGFQFLTEEESTNILDIKRAGIHSRIICFTYRCSHMVLW